MGDSGLQEADVIGGNQIHFVQMPKNGHRAKVSIPQNGIIGLHCEKSSRKVEE